MTRSILGILTLVAVIASTLLVAPAADAGAPVKFSNCTKLQKRYAHGVAQSRPVAAKQVRLGNYKPAVKPAVYRLNKRSLDRDKDGTACEVKRPKTKPTPTPTQPDPNAGWLVLGTSYMPKLEVMPTNDGASLKVPLFDAIVDDDALAQEYPVLSPAATIRYGISGTWYSEGAYYTDPLVDGHAYTFTLTVTQPAHWSCSIYNADGCSWRHDSTDVLVWSFTYSAADPYRVQNATNVSWKTKL